CPTLAFLQFIVWWKDRTARANLVFSIGAVAVAVFAGLELALMRAETPAQWDLIVRWIHVPAWVLIVSIVAFVRLYLDPGRRWLVWRMVAMKWGIMAAPLTVSLFYLILVAAMAYELSYDLIRAAQLNRQLQASEATLRESEQRFRIVADARSEE